MKTSNKDLSSLADTTKDATTAKLTKQKKNKNKNN